MCYKGKRQDFQSVKRENCWLDVRRRAAVMCVKMCASHGPPPPATALPDENSTST